jgi:hypothetical protein
MATPQEIQKLLNDLQSAYNKLGQTNPFANFDTSNIQNAETTARQLEASLKGVERQIRDISSGIGDVVSIFQSTVNEISKSNTALNDTKKTFNGLTSLAQQLRNDQEGIKKLNEKELNSIVDKVKIRKQELGDNRIQLKQRASILEEENRSLGTSKSEQKQLEKNKEELGRIKEALVAVNAERKKEKGFSQDLITAAKDRIDLEQKIGKNVGAKAFSGIADLTKSIPGLRKFSEPFKQASGAANDMARNIEEAAKSGGKGLTKEKITQLGLEGKLGNLAGAAAANKLKGMSGMSKGLLAAKAGFKILGPLIAKALGPISLIIELIGAFGRVNKETVELQKGMALSSNEAASFRSNLSTAAKQSGDINVTASKLLKTFSEVNKQFGFITNFASSTLVTMTKLTSVVGVSSEAAGNLAAASTLTGKSFESNYKDVLGTSYELQRQEGVQFDLREILEETGKVTGTVRANLGANPANIAKAITQAKLFGASLQQVASAGKSLLDFESSITSELEAELLLGKDINLERARLAALNGDQVTLAKELRKEAGDYDDFMKMNVLQQEAIAKAMGMQSDELADILFKQDIQGKTAKELRALGKDELADRLEAQTVQDKFNASVEKLKEIFADVATALMPVFEFLGMIFNLVGKIVKFLEPIMGILGGAATGAAAGAAFGPAGIIPGAIIGAITGGVSDVSRASRADDAIIPPGYGNTVIKKGRDTIALNNNDTVVAGTNLGGGNNSEAKETNTLLRQILSKQGTIKLDSTDMGTAMSVNRYAIQ